MSVLFYETSEHDLNHHGILGQKWGVRRYQNKDGTLTAAGKIHVSGEIPNATGNTYRKLTTSKTLEYAKQTAIVAASGVVALTVPELSIADMAITTAGMIRSGTANFKKKEGPPESLSEMKKGKKEEPEVSIRNVNNGLAIIGSGREINCASCSIAMDMRSRGYDVRARRQNNGLSVDDVVSLYSGAKAVKVIPNRGRTAQGVYESVCDTIVADNKGTSSGILAIQWNPRIFGFGGHAIYYKSVNGNVEFYDGQVKKSGTEIDKYFALAGPDGFSVIRTDNCEPLDGIGNCVVSTDRKKE